MLELHRVASTTSPRRAKSRGEKSDAYSFVFLTLSCRRAKCVCSHASTPRHAVAALSRLPCPRPTLWPEPGRASCHPLHTLCLAEHTWSRTSRALPPPPMEIAGVRRSSSCLDDPGTPSLRRAPRHTAPRLALIVLRASASPCSA